MTWKPHDRFTWQDGDVVFSPQHANSPSTDKDSERVRLVADILVMLFKDKALDVAKKLFSKKPSGGAAFAFNRVTVQGHAPGTLWSGPTPPSPTGWVQTTPGPRGGLRWIRSGTPGAATPPTPTPGGPSAPTPPTPGTPAAPNPGRVARLAATTTIHTAAMAKLSAGQLLTASEKADIARNLRNMSVPQLRSLHTALGGTGFISGGWHPISVAIQGLLTTGTAPSPPPVPPPAPTPPPVLPPPAPTPAPHNLVPFAISILNSGQPLGAVTKATLINNLHLMTDAELQSLYTALGGSSPVVLNGGSIRLQNTLNHILTTTLPPLWYTGNGPVAPPTPVAPPAPPLPTPSPTPSAPTPQAIYAAAHAAWQAAGYPPNPHPTAQALNAASQNLPLTPSPLHRGANVITGTPATIPVPPTPSTPAPTPPAATPPTGQPPVAKAPANTPDEVWETGNAKPGSLNGIPFAPAPHHFWEKVADVNVNEPPLRQNLTRAGILIQEPDGRVWICTPTNGFGKRKHTLPGGTLEAGLSTQQNALKEVWEETGLQVEITGYAGDFNDSNYPSGQPGERFGRLYIGKRVGGAPWDAKVESHIINHKTNKPTAESETVSLVTPERAAQLLHRTDDLAQLAMVAPISVKTDPTKNVIKKIVEGLKPRAQEYVRKKTAAGEASGDAVLHAIQEVRGFNEKPKITKKADFDTLLSQGNHIEMLRGIAAVPPSSAHGTSNLTPHQMAEQFKKGEHFPGHGMFGVGTYADSTKGYRNAATGSYSQGGEVMRIALPKSAKIIKFDDLKAATGYKYPGDYKVPPRKSESDYWRGAHAALAGYDAIYVNDPYNYGYGYYVILNRSILTVQDEPVDRSYTIK